MSFFLPAAINELDIGPGFFPIVGDRSFPDVAPSHHLGFSRSKLPGNYFHLLARLKYRGALVQSAKHSERRGGHIRHHSAKLRTSTAGSRQRNPHVRLVFRINPDECWWSDPDDCVGGLIAAEFGSQCLVSAAKQLTPTTMAQYRHIAPAIWAIVLRVDDPAAKRGHL